jgi:hypothetical protein
MGIDLILAIAAPAFPEGHGGWLPLGLDGLLAGKWVLLALITLVLVCVLVPRTSTTPLEVARELLLVIPAVLMYDLVRGVVAGRESEAIDRALRIVTIERATGTFWELEFQERILGVTPFVNFMNWTYIWGFWPVIVGAAIWLFFLHRDAYPLYRNAFLISGVIGLIIYALLPVAPPRFVDSLGFVDTVAWQTDAYALPDAPMFVNEYAAMPSLHFGWVLLVGIAICHVSSGVWPRLLGVYLPAVMLVSIVATGNHFILDAAAGAAVALIGLALAWSLRFALGGHEPLPVLPVAAQPLGRFF